MLPAEAKKKLITLMGPRGYLDLAEDLSLYEYDGSIDKARPDIVVFPRSTEDVVRIAGDVDLRNNVPRFGVEYDKL